MGSQFTEIDDKLREFIAEQKMFFVGTATAEGRVNVSPKGMDTLRVLGPNRVVWLNLTGSGNETAAHLNQVNRITVMFCAFEGRPLILRLYGTAKVIHPRDEAWDELLGLFNSTEGARQLVDIEVDLVQSSCGFGVPLYDFTGHRDTLTRWAEQKGPEGVHQYWEEKNQESLDGDPTGIFTDPKN